MEIKKIWKNGINIFNILINISDVENNFIVGIHSAQFFKNYFSYKWVTQMRDQNISIVIFVILILNDSTGIDI